MRLPTGACNAQQDFLVTLYSLTEHTFETLFTPPLPRQIALSTQHIPHQTELSTSPLPHSRPSTCYVIFSVTKRFSFDEIELKEHILCQSD